MAAIRPAPTYGDAASSPRGRNDARGWSTVARAGCIVLSIVCLGVGLSIGSAYPIAPLVAMASFVAWTVFAFLGFSFAFPAMLALLPVLAFATQTGWLTFEELDLLILASSAGGYAALARRSAESDDRSSRRNGPKLSIFSLALIALFCASLLFALERGIVAAGGFSFGWFQGYDEPLNSLRVFKSFPWAVLMTPLLLVELRKPGGLDRIGLGMTVALGLCGLAVLQERLAFTGLLDFSDDYRVTGPFWEMHVGGAALDGFLALTLPFAIREAVRNSAGAEGGHRRHARFIVACGVLVLATYACLVTFSRGVYAAIPVALVLLAVLLSRQNVQVARREAWWLMAKGGVFALLVAASAFVVFRAGGYRATLAILGVLAIAIPLESSIRRATFVTGLAAGVAAVVLAALGFGLAALLPKGPYLVYAMAFVVALAATVAADRKPTRELTFAAIASWLWLAGAAALVARNWGGPGAFVDSAMVVAAWIFVSFAMSARQQPMWPQVPHQQLATIGFAGLVMGAVAVFSAGAYMGGRFATTSSDLDLRTSHWTSGMARLHGVDAWLFGEGLGRFPATSLFDSPGEESPGSYRLTTRDGETFLALSGPKVKYLGFGELFRFSQRVSVKPQTQYRVDLRLRSPDDTSIHIELCEKHLLYPGACVVVDAKVRGGGTWQTATVPISTDRIGASRWYAPRTVFFAIATNPSPVLDVGSVAMRGPDGRDAIANGHFTNGTAHWFSSSDRYHLPWHIKNIALAVLFDQGAVGLALFVLLVGGAFLRTTIGRAFRHPDAPYIGAALGGFLVVGAADSLIDVPRVAFAFYLVTMMGLMLRTPRAPKIDAVAEGPSARAIADEAAVARAKRRQEAFGRRGPVTD